MANAVCARCSKCNTLIFDHLSISAGMCMGCLSPGADEALRGRIRYKRLRPDVLLLGRGSTHAAGFDLRWHPNTPCALEDGGIYITSAHVFETGIAFQIPEGWVGLQFSRSGHGFKHDVSLANAVGVIDADYRGEVRVKLKRSRGRDGMGVPPLHVKPGDRIAQIVFARHATDLQEVNDLNASDRGDKGYGSTGA